MDVNVHQAGDDVLAARIDPSAGFAAGELARCDSNDSRAIDDHCHVRLRGPAGAFDDSDVIDDQPFCAGKKRQQEEGNSSE
jgi:hypothetical protein